MDVSADTSSTGGDRPPVEEQPPLEVGLEPDYRYRCHSCGNLTRFDVVVTTRTRRFHHFDLGGIGQVDEEEILDRTVESVTCRWCGRADGIAVESSPVAEQNR